MLDPQDNDKHLSISTHIVIQIASRRERVSLDNSTIQNSHYILPIKDLFFLRLKQESNDTECEEKHSEQTVSNVSKEYIEQTLKRFKPYAVRTAARIQSAFTWIESEDLLQYALVAIIETATSPDYHAEKDNDGHFMLKKIRYACLDGLSCIRGYKPTCRKREAYSEINISPFNIPTQQVSNSLDGVCYHNLGISERELRYKLDTELFAKQLSDRDKCIWKSMLNGDDYNEMTEKTSQPKSTLYTRTKRLASKYRTWLESNAIP